MSLKEYSVSLKLNFPRVATEFKVWRWISDAVDLCGILDFENEITDETDSENTKYQSIW